MRVEERKGEGQGESVMKMRPHNSQKLCHRDSYRLQIINKSSPALPLPEGSVKQDLRAKIKGRALRKKQ